jgi:hypothetical protein
MSPQSAPGSLPAEGYRYATIDDALGPAAGRFFGHRHRKVQQRMVSLTPAAGRTGLCGITGAVSTRTHERHGPGGTSLPRVPGAPLRILRVLYSLDELTLALCGGNMASAVALSAGHQSELGLFARRVPALMLSPLNRRARQCWRGRGDCPIPIPIAMAGWAHDMSDGQILPDSSAAAVAGSAGGK